MAHISRTMRYFAAIALACIAALSFPFDASASSHIYSVDIFVKLNSDGSGDFIETWDVEAENITEWYLVKSNLGDIRISNFSVSDENDREFLNEGRWDVNRDIRAKAFRCGIVDKGPKGYELCWGVGSEGHHVFMARYHMTNVVKSLIDYDCFHMQLVSPGLSSSVGEANVRISTDQLSLSSANTGIWAFGFHGNVRFDNGGIVAEATQGLLEEHSMIVLARFEKGIFSSDSIENKYFSQVLDDAVDGSDYVDKKSKVSNLWDRIVSFFMSAGFFILFFILPFVGVWRSGKVTKRDKRKVLGVKPEEVSWHRDLPFDGDILKADYVLNRLGEKKRGNAIASAMVLKMLRDGQLKLLKDNGKTVEIAFDDSADFSSLSACEKELWNMMKAAAGKDCILQDKEFSRWSRRFANRVHAWVSSVKTESVSRLRADSCLNGTRFTGTGQAKARETLGFRKYLEDYTLLDERKSAEVALWQDYLIFAALYGIADKVSSELKDINPEVYGQVMAWDYDTMNTVVYMSRDLASSIANADAVAIRNAMRNTISSTPRGLGHGGFSSIGGGGGFHGGGFGGGGR